MNQGGTSLNVCSAPCLGVAQQVEAPAVHSENILSNIHIMGFFPFPTAMDLVFPGITSQVGNFSDSILRKLKLRNKHQ